MGLFDGRSYSASEAAYPRSSHSNQGGHSSSHRSRPDSPSRGSTRSPGNNGYFVRPSGGGRSSSSFFGSTSRGIFSGGGGGSSSYYRRRPRDGYISYLMHKLQRMFKELWYYARRHPVKAFFAVVVPLLSAGGAIHGLMKQFGVRIPMVDGMAKTMGGGYYGSRGYEGRGGGGGGLGGLGGLSGLAGGSGGGGWMNNAGSLMQIAKAFI